MENASKALLIAGAILIVILIIAVGMIVYNSSRGTIDEAVSQMSAQEVSMYNSQFTSFAGNRVNGSNVRALIEKVNANNTANSGVDAKIVKLTGDTTTVNAVVTSRYYTVTVTDANPAGDGLMDTIEINAVVATNP